ncbi:MAG: class I SAM-dependent methyltransferase [Chloroflexi bacterium]|nr:class I SAM-dependent methyltransferase [Chloroflexota bacterium]
MSKQSPELRSYWEGRAEAIDNYYSWRLPGLEEIVRRIEATLGDTAGIILDLGCGPGLPGAMLKRKVIGVDFTVSMIQKARRRLNHVVLADLFALPFADKAFAAAMCLFVISDYAEKDAFFREAHRVLEDGALFFLADYSPNDGWMGWLRNELICSAMEGHAPVYLEDLPTLALCGQTAGFEPLSAKRIPMQLSLRVTDILARYAHLEKEKTILARMSALGMQRHGCYTIQREFLFLILRKCPRSRDALPGHG